MSITAFTSIETLNSVLDVVKTLSNEDNFEENWSKIHSDSYESTLKNLEKKLRKTKKTAKKAYTSFTSDPEVQEKISNGKKLSIGEKSKAMSQLWKTLTPEEVQKYQSIADEYNISNNIESSKDKKNKKSKNAYNIFLSDQDFRKQIEDTEGKGLKPLELHKLIISKYKTLSEEQLNKYKIQAEEYNNSLKSSTEESEVTTKKEEIKPKEEVVVEEVVVEEEELSPTFSEKKKKKKPTKKK